MSLHNREHQKSLLNILLEILLIGAGVFLALWANNWHEDREHHALADSALRNFAAEMRTNQQAVQRERKYHETFAREVHEFVASKEPLTEARFNQHFEGVRPVQFEHTAWDLALATQALSYLDPKLAFDISRIYTEQSAFQTLQNSFLASAFTPATFSSDNFKGLATAIEFYLADVNIKEPALLQRYDEVLPEIVRALPHPNTR